MSDFQTVNSNTSELCLLVDNGSVRDHAALFTRKLAARLRGICEIPFISVSLAHSDRIPKEKLNGEPVPLLESFLPQLRSLKHLEKLYILPLLMVNEGAIYRKITAVVDAFAVSVPHIQVRMGGALVDPEDSDSISIPGVMVRVIKREIVKKHLFQPEVLVVDHGSPFSSAADIRNYVADRIRVLLPEGIVGRVIAASMERREGSAYDFNEPLLESALIDAGNREVNSLIVVKMFLQPGKHSGKRGDIDGIIQSVKSLYPNMEIVQPSQVFSQKDLTTLLKVRLNQVTRTHQGFQL